MYIGGGDCFCTSFFFVFTTFAVTFSVPVAVKDFATASTAGVILSGTLPPAVLPPAGVASRICRCCDRRRSRSNGTAGGRGTGMGGGSGGRAADDSVR